MSENDEAAIVVDDTENGMIIDVASTMLDIDMKARTFTNQPLHNKFLPIVTSFGVPGRSVYHVLGCILHHVRQSPFSWPKKINKFLELFDAQLVKVFKPGIMGDAVVRIFCEVILKCLCDIKM